MTEAQEKRLQEIRENRRIWYGSQGQLTRDFDFLLSLVDSQVAGECDANRLAFAIESAAVKAGITNSNQSLTGPQLLLLCEDTLPK